MIDDYMFCEVSGNSMYPTLCEGDILTVEKHNSKAKLGDIILFYGTNEKLYVHRIVAIFNCGGISFVTTKGDNCTCLDSPFKMDSIIGIVTNIK